MWKSLIKERFTTKDGHVKELHVLEGPTHPCMFYAGPVYARYSVCGKGMDYAPCFNATSFYHRTQDEALEAVLRIREDLG